MSKIKARSVRIKKQLGMPYGTASNQLRKRVMFMLLQDLKKNACFVCKAEISSPKELSIEHIIPWENIDERLFWDLNNISFSHLRCNRTRTRKGSTGFISKDGESWCSNCKQHLCITEFSSDQSRKRKVHKYCRTCHSTIRKSYKGRSNIGA